MWAKWAQQKRLRWACQKRVGISRANRKAPESPAIMQSPYDPYPVFPDVTEKKRQTDEPSVKIVHVDHIRPETVQFPEKAACWQIWERTFHSGKITQDMMNSMLYPVSEIGVSFRSGVVPPVPGKGRCLISFCSCFTRKPEHYLARTSVVTDVDKSYLQCISPEQISIFPVSVRR